MNECDVEWLWEIWAMITWHAWNIKLKAKTIRKQIMKKTFIAVKSFEGP